MSLHSEKLKNTLLEMLYPSRVACCICGSEAVLDARGLCGLCQSRNLEAERFDSRFYFENPLISGYSAGFRYSEYSRGAMLRLKYGGQKYVAQAGARVQPE